MPVSISGPLTSKCQHPVTSGPYHTWGYTHKALVSLSVSACGPLTSKCRHPVTSGPCHTQGCTCRRPWPCSSQSPWSLSPHSLSHSPAGCCLATNRQTHCIANHYFLCQTYSIFKKIVFSNWMCIHQRRWFNFTTSIQLKNMLLIFNKLTQSF